MYIDESGDAEANYTVLALVTNYSADVDDVERRRTMEPVGHFQTDSLTSPVFVAIYIIVKKIETKYKLNQANKATIWQLK